MAAIFISLLDCCDATAGEPAVPDEGLVQPLDSFGQGPAQRPPGFHHAIVGSCQSKYPAFDQGTLWEISKDRLLAGHVLGTLHLGAPDTLNLPDPLEGALGAAKLLVVEAIEDPYGPPPLTDPRRLPKGTKLQDLIGPESFVTVKRLAERSALSPLELQRMRPWAALAILEHIESAPSISLDDWLVERAKALAIPVIGVETVAEQFAAAGCLSLPEQALIMRETIRQSSRFKEINDRLVSFYRTRDLKGLMQYSMNAFPLSEKARIAEEKERACLIDERNAVMSQRFLEILSRERLPVLFAVGALHLPGSRGILARLVESGFTVCAVD